MSTGVVCGVTWRGQLASKVYGMWLSQPLDFVSLMMMGDGQGQVKLYISLCLRIIHVHCVFSIVTKSKCTISERLSSPRLSQSQRGSISMAPRRSSSFKHDSVLGMAKSRQSVIDIVSIPETLKREECDLVRTLANTHCLLAEVTGKLK